VESENNQEVPKTNMEKLWSTEQRETYL